MSLAFHLMKATKNLLYHFIPKLSAGMLIEWIKNKKDRNKDVLIESISKIIKNSLTGILENN